MVEEKSKVLRKPDPSKRGSIQVVTLNRVEQFLKEQDTPIFKSELVKQIGVDYNSLNMALEMLEVEYDDLARVSLKEKKDV